MKLSKVQQEVLDLMANGWELGRSEGFVSRCWLQKGGLGRGGEAKDVRSTTLRKLWVLELIKIAKEEYPVTHFILNLNRR